jgi:DNA polymerase-3 subunit alpha
MPLPSRVYGGSDTSVLDSTSKISEYIAECKKMGIEVLPPDINESEDGFTVTGENVRFGLVAVKNIGRKFILEVMDDRIANGRFTSFQNFCERMFSRDLNRRAVESLIKCGAFDKFGRRSALLQVSGAILDNIASARSKNLEGQIDFFSMDGGAEPEEVPLPAVPEFPKKIMVAYEKEVTGLYLTGHPMDEYRAALQSINIAHIGRIFAAAEEEGGGFRDEQDLTIAGMIAKVRMKTTKNDSMMAYVELEDDTGTIELIVFPKTLERCGSYIKEDAGVIVNGRLTLREDRDPQVICDAVRPISDLDQKKDSKSADSKSADYGGKLYIKLESKDTPAAFKVKPMLSMFPGEVPSVLYYADTNVREQCKITPDPRLIKRLSELLGPENVVLK